MTDDHMGVKKRYKILLKNPLLSPCSFTERIEEHILKIKPHLKYYLTDNSAFNIVILIAQMGS